MELDYGVQLDAGGMLVIPSNDAYNFGTGDFAVTALFETTQPGTIVSRKGSNGGSASCGGWLLVLRPDGVIKLATDNGLGFYEADSEPTKALDGTWHSVAAMRKDGVISIFMDGVPLRVTDRGDASTPLNVSNDLRLLIGNCDQEQEQYRQFIGGIEDVTLWNRALEPEEIRRTMLDQVSHDAPGLVGMWEMNNNFTDSSLIGNAASPVGSVSFVRVCYCVWTEAANNYSYCAIDLKPDEAERALSPNDADVAHRMQSLPVAPGTPFLYGAVIDQSKPDGAFPEGAVVRVFQPDGSELNQEVDTEDLNVHINGSSVQCFVVKNPQAGQWVFSVECPASIPILLSVQTVPTADIPQTIEGALVELYGEVPAGYARALAERGPNALAEFSFSWCDIAMWVGIALVAVAVVVTAVVVLAGTVVMSPVIVACAVAVGVGSLLVNVGLLGSISEEAERIAEDIGIGQPALGGTDEGSAYLVHDGRAYFPMLRDLLLAVQAGNYNLDGMWMQSQPTFEGLIRDISDAGKNAYVLMWDTTDIYQMVESGDYIMYFPRRWLTGRDARPNHQTLQALSGIPNVQVRLDKYPGNITSQHEKLAVFSINNVKCALVGGFNVITPAYWDDPDHPMLATDEQGQRNFHTWHDTAVFLQGPVVDLVEAEFDRRWGNTTPDASIVHSGTYAKIACWQINHDACLDQGVGDSPTPYHNPLRNLPDHPIDVLITNSQFKKPVRQIRSKLIEKIEAATDYAYFENFAFHDTSLVRAVIRKLKVAGSDFRVVIMVPHPTQGNDHTDQLGQFYLCRIAFATMVLSGEEWTQADFGNGNVIARSDCQSWSVSIPDGCPCDHSVFSCTKQDGSECSYALYDVVSVSQTPDCRLIFTSPARYFNSLDPNEDKYWLPGLSHNFRSVYIHSKLALFDDTYAVIGSANFTRRSMKNDGECCVGINDSATVQAIREELFAQWHVDSIRNWADCMNSFAQSPSERLGVVPLSIAALSLAPPPGKYWDWIVCGVDPSYFL